VSRCPYHVHAVSPSGLIPVTQTGMTVDGNCSDNYLSTSGAFVSPAVRVMSVLRIVRAVAWVTVKVLFVVVAVPLILLFAVASFGVIFAHGAW
jgi:hypothetical protein